MRRAVLAGGMVSTIILGAGLLWGWSSLTQAQTQGLSTTLASNNIQFQPSTPTTGVVSAATAIAQAKQAAGAQWNAQGPISTQFGTVTTSLYHGPAWIVSVPNVVVPVAGPALPNGASATSHTSTGTLNIIVNAQSGQPIEGVSQSTITSPSP